MRPRRIWAENHFPLFVMMSPAGYGNLAPKTETGKMVTCAYALVGIPLMLLCLSNLGQLMAGSFQFAFNRASSYVVYYGSRWCCCCRKQAKSIQEQVESGTIHLNDYLAGKGGGKKQTRKKSSAIVQAIILPSTAFVIRMPGDPADPAAPPPEPTACPAASGISDSDLTDHDYDVIPCPAETTAKAKSRSPGGGGVQRHYGLEKLNVDAHLLVENCARYPPAGSRPAGSSNQHLPAVSAEEEQELQMRALELPPPNIVTTPAELPHPYHPLPHHHRNGGGLRSTAQDPTAPRVPVVLVLSFLVGYICVGAVVFSAWEEW